MSPTSLWEQRQVNDEICRAHGFFTLEPYDRQKKKKRLTPGEYCAAMRGESWKFRLIKAIDKALEYSPDKEIFMLFQILKDRCDSQLFNFSVEIFYWTLIYIQAFDS